MSRIRNLCLIALALTAFQPALAQNRYTYYPNQGGNYMGNPLNRPAFQQTSGMQGPIGGYGNGLNSNYGNGYGGYGGRYTTGGGYYNQYPYANQPGYGYYGGSPYVVGGFPALGAPVPMAGGMFRFNVGGFGGSYWRAPSGYYYPWGAGAVYANPAPVIIVNEGSSQVAQPPVSGMLGDMSAYIEDQNTKKKFKSDDYQHLARRVRDLQNLESSMRSRNNGTLDPSDEETLRKDCAMLSGDISRRVLP